MLSPSMLLTIHVQNLYRQASSPKKKKAGAATIPEQRESGRLFGLNLFRIIT